ncbi:MAG: phosphomannose isomerase type II C-terminal cupin domain [Candidatus Pacebacteria bacterium]|nr:phosphomannose isomerase type II C-terminal cupin domain [Candidatus Paceibacterota bacterium]
MKTLTVEKPWGKFEQFDHNEVTTVKIITVKPHGKLSLQYHAKRAEFWRVLSGHPIVTEGDKVVIAKPGDEFVMDELEEHRVEAQDEQVQILEIAYGDFQEEDIIRLKDVYGRIKK